MKWFFVLYCSVLWLYCVPLCAQTAMQEYAVADSLRRVIATAKYDTTRVNAMIEMSWLWWDASRMDSALIYAQRAQEVALRSGFRKGTADAESIIANVYWFQGKYAQALEHYTASLHIRETLGNKLAIASTLNNIGNVYSRQGNNSEALEYYTKALKIHQELGNIVQIANLLLNIGVIYFQQDKYIQALENYTKALRIYREQNNKEDIALALSNIGNVYTQQGKYGESLESHFKVLRIREELGKKASVANSLNNIGNVYLRQGRYNEALESYFKSLQINEALGDKVQSASSLILIGNTYCLQGNYSKALENFSKALKIREELGNKANIAICLNNIGSTYRVQGKYSEALEYQLRALQTQEALGNILGISAALNEIGHVYRLQGKFEEALSYSLHSLRLADSIGVRERKKEALEALAACYDSLGQHKRALEYHRQYVALKDSLVNAESLEKTAKLRESYEAEKREQQIALLNKEKEILNKDKDLLTKDQALKESEITRQQAELFRVSAEQQAQAQSILLLRNEQQVQELTLQQQEAALTEAHLRAERNNEALKLSAAQEKLQQAELSRRNIIQWLLAGILVAVTAGAVWLGALYRQKNAANKAILQQQTLLEDQAHEIQQANMELHQQNEVLAALNAEKNELMGIVSHDLQNPIGAVRNYAELIQSGFFESAEVLGVASQIEQVSNRMLELVRNLLDMNHLESGGFQVNVVNFDVAPIVEAAADQYRTLAAAKNITLHFSNEVATEGGGSVISADEQVVMQILDNLVSNAVKYSPHGKNIWVRMKSEGGNMKQIEENMKQEAAAVSSPIPLSVALNISSFPLPSFLRVEVQDEGPGISPEDMKKLFGKFARLSAQPTGGEHSTGLGLSIVKKMVETMKGRVWCESELGNGATFIVELPKVLEVS